MDIWPIRVHVKRRGSLDGSWAPAGSHTLREPKVQRPSFPQSYAVSRGRTMGIKPESGCRAGRSSRIPSALAPPALESPSSSGIGPTHCRELISLQLCL